MFNVVSPTGERQWGNCTIEAIDGDGFITTSIAGVPVTSVSPGFANGYSEGQLMLVGWTDRPPAFVALDVQCTTEPEGGGD